VASTGELLKSAQAALKFITESQQYNERDVSRLNLFLKQIIAEWRKTHVTSSSSSLVLPEGWKARVGGSREYVVSPEGDQFDSERLALVEMVKRGLPESDLNKLRDSMAGWESSELLPKGWRAKTGRKCEFISHSGDWVSGRVQALELIRGMAPEDMTNFEKYSKQLTVQTREQNFVWNEDDKSIPAGWKSRLGGSKWMFLSPSGEQFPTRVAALQRLVQGGQDSRQVDEMRSLAMEHEGWRESKHLPFKWIFKHFSSTTFGKSRGTQNNLRILSEDGHLIESYVAAKLYMEQGDKYDQDDLNNIQLLAEENARERRLQDANREVVDITVPAGWKTKAWGSKTILISPEGVSFPCRRAALEHMAREGWGMEEVEEMRELAVEHEGWQRSKHLPHGWIFKWSAGPKFGSRININILSEDGHMMGSYSSARIYLKENAKYDEECIANLEKLITEVGNERRLASCPVGETNMDEAKDKSVPSGWKTKAGGSKTFIISPEGVSFPCRRAALQHMLRKGWGRQEVEEMRGMVVDHENWASSDHLPPGWLYKLSSGIELLSREGEVYSSYLVAREYMRASSLYTEEDQHQLELLGEEVARRKRCSDESWEVATSLPEGWKVKVKKAHDFFLSPEGYQVSGLRAVLRHLVVAKRPVLEVEVVREALRQEDWQEEEQLPEGWLAKTIFTTSSSREKSRNLKILSPEGFFFTSYLAALNFIQQTELKQ